MSDLKPELLARLRAWAKAAMPCADGSTVSHALVMFQIAADPPTILALLDEVERLRELESLYQRGERGER